MKSLMLCPFVKSVPFFVKNIIENYSYHPDYIEWKPNDPQLPDNENRMDYKAVTLFEKLNPDDIFIMHATDHYLNHDDLREMIEILNKDEKAFCIGIHPITGNRFSYYPDDVKPHYMTRIVVWKAKLFRDYLDEGKSRTFSYLRDAKGKIVTDMEDMTSHVAQACTDAGYHALQATKARCFKVDFK